ncbi:MAG: hypothetical protein R3F49_02560 [Planctomycetota bacterium]
MSVAVAALALCAASWPQVDLAARVNERGEPQARAALTWTSLPPLPDALGYGGPFVATLAGPAGETLLVAGGANFPGGPPWAGGVKVWHADTWLFDGDAWRAGPPLPAARVRRGRQRRWRRVAARRRRRGLRHGRGLARALRRARRARI